MIKWDQSSRGTMEKHHDHREQQHAQTSPRAGHAYPGLLRDAAAAADDIVVKQARSRATPKGVQVAGGYLTNCQASVKPGSLEIIAKLACGRGSDTLSITHKCLIQLREARSKNLESDESLVIHC